MRGPDEPVRRWGWRYLPALLTLAACTGTADADALRKAWLVDAIVDDNRVWLSRDPTLLATKYDKMGDDPYDFMRGTAAVFLRDLARAGTDRAPTAFLTDPEAAEVLLAGDPHPENIGTLSPTEGVLLLELNDFDGSAFGPYLLDLRRMLVGVAYLGDEGRCGSDCAERLVRATTEAYLRELVSGYPWTSGLVDGRVDPVTQTLLDDVIEEGLGRERLLEYTQQIGAGRRFRIDPTLDDGRGIRPLDTEERRQLQRLLSRWSGAPAGFRVLDQARRYGSGVASLPAVRYVVAYDTGDDDPGDDGLLSIREVVDPPAVPGVHAGAPAYWDDHGHRIEDTARTMWSRPDADPHYAGLVDGPMTFKVQTMSSWHNSFDHTKILRDVDRAFLTVDDLEAWCTTLGQLLARAHARSPTARGGRAGEAILRDIGGAGEAFVAERVRDALADRRQLRTDHRLFHEARDELGALLGADLLEDR
mgnify:CR=1 FL=1